MKTIVTKILSFFVSISALTLIFTSPAFAQNPPKLQDLECVFNNAVSFLLPTAALIFFVMFVVGGFKYLTSTGDLAAVAGAHKTLTYALMGLIVVALAYLVLVIINTLTGAPILRFIIYQGGSGPTC